MGDLVDQEPYEIPWLSAGLTALRAREAVVAVPGNHDYAAEPDLKVFRTVIEQAGVAMQVRIESGTSAAACGSAQAGLGVALVNALMANEFGSASLATVPFRPVIQTAFGMLLPRSATPPRATLALLDCLREAALEQAGPRSSPPRTGRGPDTS